MKYAFFFFAAVLMAGCGHAKPMTPKAIQSEISASVPVGSPQEKLLQFFRSKEWSPTFDEFAGRYQLAIRTNDQSHAVMVYFYVDKDHRFVRAEVFDSYTGP